MPDVQFDLVLVKKKEIHIMNYKLIKKILAVLMAVSAVTAFASCGKK